MKKTIVEELAVHIPIGDWEALLLQEEPEITDLASLVKLYKRYPISQLAKMIAAAEARGDTPTRLLNLDKLLYHSGIKADIAEKVAAQTENVRLENGRDIEIRSLVGTPPSDFDDESDEEDADADEKFGLAVDSLSQMALDRSLRYLQRSVPGYVYGRLKIIAANHGDVREAANVLVVKIWEMVEGLE